MFRKKEKQKYSISKLASFLKIFAFIIYTQLYGQSEYFNQPNKMRIDSKTGIPKAIYNVISRKYSGSPLDIAKQYLIENKDLFKLEKDLIDLKSLEVKKSPAGHHISFMQYYKNIPVFGSETVISINNNNQISMVINGYTPNISVNVTPSITAEEATLLAHLSVNAQISKEKINIPVSELIVYEDSVSTFHLCWKVFVKSMNPFGEWIIYVDAHEREVISKFNSFIGYGNGTGTIFKPDPGSYHQNATLTDLGDSDYALLQSVYKDETLLDLDDPVGGLYYLKGKYA